MPICYWESSNASQFRAATRARALCRLIVRKCGAIKLAFYPKDFCVDPGDLLRTLRIPIVARHVVLAPRAWSTGIPMTDQKAHRNSSQG